MDGDEKWITYDNNVRKRSKQDKAQPITKPELTKEDDAVCLIGRKSSTMSCCRAKRLILISTVIN